MKLSWLQCSFCLLTLKRDVSWIEPADMLCSAASLNFGCAHAKVGNINHSSISPELVFVETISTENTGQQNVSCTQKFAGL